MLQKHFVMGVHITNRLTEAVEVQRLLTQYGKFIKTRLGMHETEQGDDPNGLLILEMVGSDQQNKELADGLDAIEGVEVKVMEFDHPMP